ncbi:MAG TPA: cyclophilin-like fold protein [Geminicoccus sp.]|nr:cyclophilin-like fold protein [Geminicoccus sp.]
MGTLDMTCHSPSLTRRTVLGAVLVGTAMARPALAQTAQHPSVGREKAAMRIRIAFNGLAFTATLDDNPSARDLASMLPLDLTIEDYSTNEKIAYLPRKLTEEGSGPFTGEAPGDLCYYAPWGNLAFFHAGYRYSRGLVRLGRLDGGIEPLLTRGEFPLRIEHLS